MALLDRKTSRPSEPGGISYAALLPYPPIVTLEDVFVPDIAAPLIEGLRGLGDEELAVTIQLRAPEMVVCAN